MSGLVPRARQKCMCVSSGSLEYRRLDRKAFYGLLRCGGCCLVCCWPGDTEIGYERSEPRAVYSTKLGVGVFTDWSEI